MFPILWISSYDSWLGDLAEVSCRASNSCFIFFGYRVKILDSDTLLRFLFVLLTHVSYSLDIELRFLARRPR
jgi:hypothetical protein